MPFVKKGEDTLWRASNEAHVTRVLNRVRGIEESSEDKKPNVIVGLEDHVSKALSTMIPSYGRQIIAQSNESLYEAVGAFAKEAALHVDIILPVHNAIHIVEQCIQSVLTRTFLPYHLFIVDDASDCKTKEVLAKVTEENPEKITLITNKKNKGFAATVNRGMRAGDGKYIVLLNSDVMVTPRWLTKMVMALEADRRNQIVNPVTNNTAVIDVGMAEGASYLQMNRVFEKYAERRYPEVMPTGFCFLFKRYLLDQVGYFDEGYENYGEETDFWMKAMTYLEGDKYMQFRGVLADDTYCFHERGSSFSSKGEWDHLELRKNASSRFHTLWPQFANWRQGFNVEKALGSLKTPISAPILNAYNSKYKVCFVVHSTSFCGGMKYICDLVNEINERGGDARVALINRPDQKPMVLNELRVAPVVFKDVEDFSKNFAVRVFDRGFVVASTVEQAPYVSKLLFDFPKLKGLLHVQSYEPFMAKDEELKKKLEADFRLIPKVISNADWISGVLKKEIGISALDTIHVGVDQKLFYPRDREDGDERPTLMMPFIKSYPIKGYKRGTILAKEVFDEAAKRGLDIRVLGYGMNEVVEEKRITALGPLSQNRLAKVLGTEVDVFLDPSSLHSYGLPALEALASGITVVGWDNRGIKEYIKDGETGKIFGKKTTVQTIAKYIVDLLESEEKRKKITNPEKVAETLANHDRAISVDSFIKRFEKAFSLDMRKKRIVFVTPHLRKHGGPTTIVELADKLAKRYRHDISITTMYTDVNPELTGRTKLDINLNCKKIPDCDVLIVNSDNPMNKEFIKLSQAKKKVMLKLSHNERFKDTENDSLKLPWDKIVTSTQWLKEACETPLEGWDHAAVPATRIGWYHYAHKEMKCPPGNKRYGDGVNRPVVIGTLIHHHPLKGSRESLDVLSDIKEKYGKEVVIVGVGEVDKPHFVKPGWMDHYVKSPDRDSMAQVMSNLDIWLGCSHTEGLGRMALEAMSASAACVITDTGAEYAINETNCLLVPVSGIKEMKDAVTILIENPSYRREVGAAGFETAEQISDPTETVEALGRVIEGLFK